VSFAFTNPAPRKIAITVAIVQGLSIAVISPDPVAVCRRRQQAAIDGLERRTFSVQAMHPIKDKRARLRVAARYIKLGGAKFPRTGCEQLRSMRQNGCLVVHHLGPGLRLGGSGSSAMSITELGAPSDANAKRGRR